MYLKNIIVKNMGPIEKIDLELEFEDNGNPKPVILVGENGKGKSTVLGTIVDSLFEFSRQAYNDIVGLDPQGLQPYFKIESRNNIKVGNNFSLCFFNFFDEIDKSIMYLAKNGQVSKEECNSILNGRFNIDSVWDENSVSKKVTNNKEKFEAEFNNKSFCYFPPNRYQRPYWMNENVVSKESLNIKSRVTGNLNKPIMIEDVSRDNINWLLDIIVDSRTDVFENNNGGWSVEQDLNNIRLLKIARANTEEILSAILKKDVKFGLNWRNSGDARFNLIDRKTNNIIVPTLNSLSTGENAMFNIFFFFFRNSDYSDLNKSIKLNEIEGIVVIDEIELHLHSTVQRDILPRLIHKFPKVQFIVTSHSPLFIMGMEEVFKDKGFSIFEMPNGEKISSEEFSEFEKSYGFYKESKKYKTEIQDEIDKKIGKTLVVTEGCTDWKHLKRAFEKFKEEGKFVNLDFEFLEFEDKNSKSGLLKLDMGDTRLNSMCEYYSRIPQKRKVIFIGDRDTKESKKLSIEDKHYKSWGNNVYSFQLPVPEHRKDTPEICIEHYYFDEEIKTPDLFEDKIERRLFMGNDFNKNGIYINGDTRLMCQKRKICGKDKINIIEGSDGEKVINIDSDDDINYAMPKTIFANNILYEKGKFGEVGYTNFEPVFNILEEIIES